MELPQSDKFHKMSVDSFNTEKLLTNASRQRDARNYHEFPIIDTDAHQYETESISEIIEFIDDEVLQHLGYANPGDTIITGVFQAVSIATTTGFTTADFATWPAILPVALILASFIGGSAGSTAGGIKVVRCLLIYKQGVREIVRLVHPTAEIPVKLGNTAVQYRVVDAVWGFFSVYIVVFVVLMLAMMATGLDQVTAFSAIAATLNNLGPGLGEVADGFMTLTDTAKWIAVAGMLLGRLEIFTLLVLITPTFWRH